MAVTTLNWYCFIFYVIIDDYLSIIVFAHDLQNRKVMNLIFEYNYCFPEIIFQNLTEEEKLVLQNYKFIKNLSNVYVLLLINEMDFFIRNNICSSNFF